MYRLLTFFLLTSFVGLSLSMTCIGKPNGFYEVSCLYMTKCTNGKMERILCPHGHVVDTDVHQCRPIEKVKPPCGKTIDCSTKADGTYPDLDQNCRSYHTCLGGNFFGHNLCPETLVFNSELKLCDFKANVLEPCGAKKKGVGLNF